MNNVIKSLKFIYFLARYNPDKYPRVEIKDEFYKGLDNSKTQLRILSRFNKKDKNFIIIFPGASPDAEKHTGLLFLASIICKLGYVVLVPRIPPLKDLKLNHECHEWFAHAYFEIINRQDVIKANVSTMALSFGGGLLLKASLDSKISSSPPKSIMTFGTYCDIQSTLKFLCNGEIYLKGSSYKINPHSWGLTVLLHNFLDKLHFKEIESYKSEIQQIVNLRIQDRLDEVQESISKLPDIPANFIQNIFDSKINDEIENEISRAINKEKEFIKSMSPKYWANKIKNKVFIMHGSNDSMVPFTESIELHRSIEASSLFVSYMYEHKEISTDKGIIFKVKEFYKMFKFFNGYFKYNES